MSTRRCFRRRWRFSDFYFGSDDWEYPLGLIQMCAISHADQIKGEALPGWLEWLPDMPFERDRAPFDGFLACSPKTCRIRTTASITRMARCISTWSRPTRRRSSDLKRKLKEVLSKIGWPAVLLERSLYLGKDIPLVRHRAPGGHVPLRHGSGDVGAEPRLPRARSRQSLHHRRELLPLDRRGEPDTHDHRQRAARGRHHQGAGYDDGGNRRARRSLWPGAAVPAVQRARQDFRFRPRGEAGAEQCSSRARSRSR